MRTPLSSLLFAVLVLSPAAAAQVAPFTAARHTGDDGYVVRVEEEWYALVSLDDLEAARLRAHCEETYGERALKRFSEDLLEVFEGLGHEPGDGVDLVLERLEGGERVELTGVPLTRENRQRCWEFNYHRETGPVQRVEREHAASAAPAYAHLTEALAWEGWQGVEVPLTEAREDLDQLEWHVRNEYSYRDLTGVDVEAAFDAALQGLGEGGHVSLGSFALTLTKLLALFGDGHTRLELSLGAIAPEGYAPYLLAEAEGGVVAFASDRSDLVDPAHPFVVAIDGLPLEDWLAAAAEVVPRGAPHYVRERGLRALRQLAWARLELGRPESSEVVLTLRDTAEEQVDVSLPLTSRRPTYGAWPRASTRLLEGRFGYLRIASMDGDAEFLRGLHAAMDSFRGTEGLVIDVRGNGGGSRHALRELLPYLLGPDDPPVVTNAAAYRLREGDDPEGLHLVDRFLWPASWPGWSPPERAAIEVTEEDFEPDWELPEGDFGALCWMVVPRDSGPEAPLPYDQPVVVLLDGSCFSATDVFLGGLAELPDVVLVGTPSGGGSGRSRPVRLAHSELALRISSMASFRPDGRRYDGLGVAPDVLVRPAPEDLVGASDAQLSAALAVLSGD